MSVNDLIAAAGGAAGGVDVSQLADLAKLAGGVDLGAITGLLTGGSSAPASKCTGTGEALKKCQDAEKAAAAAAAIKRQRDADAKFKEEYANIKTSSTGLACSMDGFTDMAIKLTENLLLVVSLLKETLAYAVPAELGESFELLWKGLVGSSSWLGFAAYALFAVGIDDGWEMDVCEAFGYLYYVIDGMNYIVAFASPSEDGSGSGASATDLLAAAADAASGLGIDIPSEVTDAAKAATDAIGTAEGALQDNVDANAAAAESSTADSTTPAADSTAAKE